MPVFVDVSVPYMFVVHAIEIHDFIPPKPILQILRNVYKIVLFILKEIIPCAFFCQSILINLQ